MRCSNDGGVTWGNVFKFIGDDGDGAGNVINNELESTDGEIVLMDGGSARVIRGSGVLLSALAAANHTHSGVYALVDHTHSGIYALLDHTHSGVYALVDHAHDDVYAPKSGWTSCGAVTTASTSTFTVDNNTANEEIFTPGRPLILSASGVEHYLVVKTWASGTVTVMGSALTSSTPYNVSYGNFDKLIQVDLNLPGAFAETYSASGIRDIAGDYFSWGLPPARFVGLTQRIFVSDSEATTANPKINVCIGTPSSSSTLSGSGTTYTIQNYTLGATLVVTVNSGVVTNYSVDFATGTLIFDETPGVTPVASYKCWVASDIVLNTACETDTERTDSGITVQKDYARILKGDRVELLIEKASGGTPGDDAETLTISLFFVME